MGMLLIVDAAGKHDLDFHQRRAPSCERRKFSTWFYASKIPVIRRLFRPSPTMTQALCLVAIAVCNPVRMVKTALAETPAAHQTHPKHARLYAKARFISGPVEHVAHTQPFVIGEITPAPFGAGLNKLAGRKLKCRPSHIGQIKSLQDDQSCHLRLIPVAAASRLVSELLQRTANQPVLVGRDEPHPEAVRVTCTFERQGDTIISETDPAKLKCRCLMPDGRLLSLKLVRVVAELPCIAC